MSDLSDIFAKDPNHYVDQDTDTIIEWLRGMRQSFNAGNTKAGNTKSATPKQKQIEGLASALDLKGIDL